MHAGLRREIRLVRLRPPTDQLTFKFSLIDRRLYITMDFSIKQEGGGGSPSQYSYSYNPIELSSNFQKLKDVEDKKKQDQPASTTSLSDQGSNNTFVVASVQLTAGGLETNQLEGFWKRAQEAVIQAVEKGANVILLPELFLGPYFCQTQEACLMDLATEEEDCFIIKRMQILAKTYGVVLPISFFERSGNALYNSIVVIDADGTVLGKYRKVGRNNESIGFQTQKRCSGIASAFSEVRPFTTCHCSTLTCHLSSA